LQDAHSHKKTPPSDPKKLTSATTMTDAQAKRYPLRDMERYVHKAVEGVHG